MSDPLVSTAALIERGQALYTPNYKPMPVVFARGEGVWLYDRNGKSYLDFAAGIAVNSLGHAHPTLTRVLSEQAANLLHVSNIFFTEPTIRLADRLANLSFGDRVYFANSGAEANEAALKLARRYMRLVRGEDRFGFICAQNSFHGRTWAAISATGQPKYHKGFEPLVPGFTHVPYNDLAAVEKAIDETTCAVFVEPLQGEGGIINPSPDYLPGLRKLCDEYGILLIFDEVQTGVGRTGEWFCYEHTKTPPDIMSLAKGLGGGVPIGAMICTEKVAQGFAPGAHASTFGGNPLACSAGLAVLDTIETDDLLPNVREVGAYLLEGLATLSDLPGIKEPRGLGLLCGVAVDPALDRPGIRAAAMARGLVITQAGSDTLRLSPPLIVGRSHVDDAIARLRDAIKDVVK